MTAESIDPGREGVYPFDAEVNHDGAIFSIPVEDYIARYEVTHPLVTETLHEYPVLCYLLGRVTDEPQGVDTRPDGVERPTYYLMEGSGMFALRHPQDAMRWRGIFNHVMGTARQVYWLAERLTRTTAEERELFGRFGFDASTFSDIDPVLLRNFMFISHAFRRPVDERTWDGLRDAVHPSGDSGVNTLAFLRAQGADPRFLALMRVEMHADHLTAAGGGSVFPDLVDNILTYCDWTFGQRPSTLAERFAGLRKSGRAAPEVLDILERGGNAFEGVLRYAIDPHIFEHMTGAGPYEWERKIRQAYCAPSGIALADAFPDYAARYEST